MATIYSSVYQAAVGINSPEIPSHGLGLFDSVLISVLTMFDISDKEMMP